MNPETALIHFQTWAQEECAGQGRILAALERMEAAVGAASDGELAAGCAELEAAIEGSVQRAARREMLCSVLGAHFGVAGHTLSVTSILERAQGTGLGPESVRRSLANLRGELRAAVLEVNRSARRLQSLAHHQRGFLDELLAVLGAPGGRPGSREGGQLVDAEA